MEIKDKVIWVTGGNSGMGEACARLFVSKGAKVLMTARREEQGQALAEELGENAMFVAADSKKWEDLKAAADKAVEKWGTINHLVSAAGGSEVGGILLGDDPDQVAQLFKDMKHGLDLNLMGNFYAAQIAATYMVKNEPEEPYGSKGTITIIASMAADKIWQGKTGLPPAWYPFGYGTSKAALLGLTRDLSYRLGEVGIRVNAIKPGYVLTPMQTPELRAAADQGVHIFQNFPKAGGTAEQMASLCAEIINNDFINATSIAIDGGVHLNLIH